MGKNKKNLHIYSIELLWTITRDTKNNCRHSESLTLAFQQVGGSLSVTFACGSISPAGKKPGRYARHVRQKWPDETDGQKRKKGSSFYVVFIYLYGRRERQGSSTLSLVFFSSRRLVLFWPFCLLYLVFCLEIYQSPVFLFDTRSRNQSSVVKWPFLIVQVNGQSRRETIG